MESVRPISPDFIWSGLVSDLLSFSGAVFGLVTLASGVIALLALLFFGLTMVAAFICLYPMRTPHSFGRDYGITCLFRVLRSALPYRIS
jgi:hypothetical protein